MKPRNAAILLVFIGTMQMSGDLLANLPLKAIGAATGASPAPKVFTEQNGIETFTARFWIDWTRKDGTRGSTQITPHTYSGLRGPYNRRNPFGAALAGGPWLSESEMTAPMFRSVTRHALCGEAPLLHELGLDPEQLASVSLRVDPRVTPRDASKQWTLTFDGGCHG